MWKVVSEENILVIKPYLEVIRQNIVTESGVEVDDYYQIRLEDFSVGCAVTPDGRIITLRQYRHGARRAGLCFPAGGIRAETPEAAMRRELLEETGCRAASLQSLGTATVNGNQGCGNGHFFLLRDCEKIAEPNSGDLEQAEIRLMEIDDVDKAVAASEFPVITDIALWALARPLLGGR